ncbi:TVP38/TMEM64 family protein [Desulfurivibrio alkaliphilus]|uniref:TVP38/TMEM64 family membrane protein n=1 Tax=Desulfurivibrio alkaliphilus (strain DSM 19089 / UNIQEM U267 / AHT2) TaxID=589865 RepID=D6Z1C7_DESAT|nr:TVP38/TMEM64 family protein [Desulfurivibrio alkaliphilus]ADH85382.1 SNARE associated Golgi protein-related protein [Desulfurivibrio alkaliphilus AHT 2]
MKIRLLVAGLLAMIVAMGLYLLPARELAVEVMQWVEGLGFTGYVVFFLLYAFFTLLFLPGFILTVGAGAIFGLAGGFVAVSLGSTVGAALAFLLGRFLAREAVERKVAGNSKFAAIDAAVAQKGWKIVFLTRLSPVFPFNLINYAYGLTRIPFPHYVLASWIGMMPGTLLYVYAGSLAGNVARAALEETPSAGTWELAFQGLGLLATLTVTIYVTRLARQALQQAVPVEKQQ